MDFKDRIRIQTSFEYRIRIRPYLKNRIRIRSQFKNRIQIRTDPNPATHLIDQSVLDTKMLGC